MDIIDKAIEFENRKHKFVTTSDRILASREVKSLIFKRDVSSEASYEHKAFSFYAKEESDTRIKIMDFTGQIIYTQKEFFGKDKHSFQLDVSHFESGIYVLSFFSKDKMHTKRFVVKE